MSDFVSICLLAYKRPERLKECLHSIRETADYPYELIVNVDGGDKETMDLVYNYSNLYNCVSKMIFVNGKNRGVGTSFANCVKLSEGAYIFKVDTDLTFSRGWLSQSVHILNTYDDIGACGLFDYRKYDPSDTRFEVLDEREDCRIVNDLVSSAYCFRSKDTIIPGWDEDDGYHQKLGELALTKTDMARNSGFGVGNSVYVSGTMDNPRKTETFSEPLIIKP